MPFMLFTIFAALLLLFTGMAGAECNGKDKSWSDLGDGNAIEAAIKDACSRMAGDYENGSMVDGCANVGENHIEARIEIKTKPENGKSDVTLVEGVCHILLDGVKRHCPKKGGTTRAAAWAGSKGHEHDYINGKISAYPKEKNCNT